MSSILSFSIPIHSLNPRLEPYSLDPGVSTLDQASGTLPEGAYTTFRTYPNRMALQLEDHFKRLEYSTRLAGYSLKLDRSSLRNCIRTALDAFPASIARVRIVIPFSPDLERLYIFVGALSVPDDYDRRNGVRVTTRQFQRSTPGAKLTGFIQATKQIREHLPSGIEEIIMLDDQHRFLEGLTSNFFAVINGEIWTAGEGVLSGITRQFVLEIAQNAGIRVNFSPPSQASISEFEEAFITSTSRAVLPVTEIDGISIGSGIPGPITTELMEQFNNRVENETEPI